MNVLHINPDFPFTALYSRMMETFSTLHGHTVYVPLALGRQLPDSSSTGNGRVIYSRDYRQLHRLFYGWKTRRISTSLVQQLKVDEFDLVHAHFLFSAGGVAYTLKKRFGIQYVVTVQNTDVNTFFRLGIHVRKKGLRILQDAQQIIFNNPAYLRFVLERYVPEALRQSIQPRCNVIPYGVDPFWLSHASRDASSRASGRVSLLYVGDFTKNKNVEAVLAVVKLLRKRGYEADLDLVGDGPTFPRIRELVRDLPYVRLHGRIRSKEVLLQRYRQADVFLMPSFTETFGLVYVEAMSQGVPVIFSKGQGIDGYFPEGSIGYSVDPRSPSLIADRVEEILRNHEQMSVRCTEAAQQFSWPEISGRLEQLYEKAFSRSNSGGESMER